MTRLRSLFLRQDDMLMEFILQFKKEDDGTYSILSDPIAQRNIPEWIDIYYLLIDGSNPLHFLFRSNSDFNELAKYLHSCGVQAPKFGEWIPVHDPFNTEIIMFYRCSVCGRREATKEPFCNCGAKMKTE